MAARKLTVAGALVAGLAVAFGAFGAHALGDTLTESAKATYATADRYQLAHGIALVVIGVLVDLKRSRPWPGWLMLAGIVVFCGSLYALSLTGIRAFGAVAPAGGSLLIASWFGLGFEIARTTRR
ncbi:MAG: DUF423 domain-containing protein [Fimbriimonadaceae bacterium]